MRILRLRRGFQADHSSSSYLFYAVDRPVSEEGRRIAHRYSSRAEVSARTARYQKWGESELPWGAYKSLLGAHYDLMASESYDWWTFMIAVPKTSATEALLAPFADARGIDDQGVDVEDYGERLVAVVHCRMDYGGPVFGGREDPIEAIAERLKSIRKDLLAGNAVFLRAVVDLYAGEVDEGADEAPEPGAEGAATKADLLAECARRGIVARSSWTKARIASALESAASRRKPPAGQRPVKLSRAARELVDSMEASS